MNDYPIFRQADFMWSNKFSIIETNLNGTVITINVSDRQVYHSIFDLLSKAYECGGKFHLVARGSSAKLLHIKFHSVSTLPNGLTLLLIAEEVKEND